MVGKSTERFMNESSPLPNGSIGRDERGRFSPGWRGGPGNPLGKRMEELKQAVLESTTPEQVGAVMGKLHEMAMAGDVAASEVWLDRVLGRARQSIELQPTSQISVDGQRALAVVKRLLAGPEE